MMPRRTKEAAKETRWRILEAALEVFCRKGYARTTFVDIAKEVGLSKGAVYWHFKSKPDLLAAMIVHVRGKHHKSADKMQPGSLSELRKLLLDHAKMVSKHKDVLKFEFFSHLQIEWSEELLAEVHQKLSEWRDGPKEKLITTLADLQKKGELHRKADLEKLSLSLFAMWIGALQLLLRKMCNAKQFHALLEQHFDLVVGQYATRPVT
jgi:TetR/AcrR family acrAB operon transcriptional repressor